MGSYGGEILPQTTNPPKENQKKEDEKIKIQTFLALFPLYPDLFKGINQRFSLSPAVLTDPKEASETIICTSYYESGANFLDSRLMLAARVMADGKLNFSQAQCHGMVSFDYKDEHSRTHLQLGNGALSGAPYIQDDALLGASYIKSITPGLSLDSQVFWGGQHRKPAVGVGGRFNNDKMVSVAFDKMYNYMSGEDTMSVGCEIVFKQCRLRGKMDSNGRVAGFLEQQLSKGRNFVFSAEVDTKRKDSRFGFGLSLGK
ncbi:hypothetical protein MKW94_028314 [Papaver nudicaule]|uniref:Uncharacterized protein n=1 Tax=Papaver nudicaule TaxID=74823 RepID=A0AA41VD27_PAPNU|nr:hypothetical protein [Papaver nudicaule]